MAASKAANKKVVNKATEGKNIKSQKALKAVKITKLKWNGEAYANGLEFEEFDKFNESVKAYIEKISEIKVNNRKYVELLSASPDEEDFAYDFSAQGLRLKKGAFKEGINKITMQAEGYMTKVIKFAKTDDLYTFLSQEDRDSNSPEEPQLNPEPLKKAIEDAKKIEKGDKTAAAWQALKLSLIHISEPTRH